MGWSSGDDQDLEKDIDFGICNINKGYVKREVGERQGSMGKGEDILKIGTWNFRGINGKEMELVKEIGKIKLDILGITETEKGVGFSTDSRQIYYVLIWGR